jgi:hypothetical protein
MVETKMIRGQPPGRKLVADVTAAEHARSEADEGVERDEDDVEVVDEQV